MRADKRSVGAIFDHTLRLVAPLFQRPYVWEEEANWVPLWEAITEAADRRLALDGRRHRPHFLGAMVLDQLRTQVGEIEARQIIDGQQRMTTLQLAIAAIRDLSKLLDLPKYHAAWSRLSLNEIPLSDDPDEKFKVWPTNIDQNHFRRTITAGSFADLTAAYSQPEAHGSLNHPIPKAYLFFFGRAANWLGDVGGDELDARMRALYLAIKDDLHIVTIDLDPEDDAQLIFETLNALGAPLLPADLVKNFLFHEAPASEVVHLYEEYWRPLDEQHDFWRKQVRQGRLNRPRIDVFLQHYLTLVTRDETGATHLFAAFRDYADANPHLGPTDHLRQIRTYSRIYHRFDTYPEHSREGVFFYRLEQLDTSTVLPLLLEVFRQMEGAARRDELLQVLDYLESFLIRRAICGLTPKNYNRLFLDLLQFATIEAPLSAEAIRDFLLRGTTETNRWPDDQEFRTALLHDPLYNRLVRKRLRMVLEALEATVQTELTEATILKSKDLQVEHLMPQKWAAHWPLPGIQDRAVEAEHRGERIHRLGNLTLLTRKLNPSVSNGPWENKIDKILEHSALALNRKLRAQPWDEAAIDRRGAGLAEVAIGLWRRPEDPLHLS